MLENADQIKLRNFISTSLLSDFEAVAKVFIAIGQELDPYQAKSEK
ncbi:MAG: hypothetical protein HY847_11635 [Betaproteobacteria bacterium]|nr:hypothetical protein [Betaproteobacteria bacterium]